MIVRSAAYALAPLEGTLESLVAGVSTALAAAQAQLGLAAEARRLVEDMLPGDLPDWTPDAAWGAQLESGRLAVCGPRTAIAASFSGDKLATLQVETADGTWDLARLAP